MKHDKNTCKVYMCCKCEYGSPIERDLLENPIDLVFEVNMRLGYKLKSAYAMQVHDDIEY